MRNWLIAAVALLYVASAAAQSPSTPVRRSYDTAFLGEPLADPALQHAKETFVLFGCAYCHGLNLVSRGEATDLMHSALVGRDVNGDRIGALLRAGIPQTAKLSPMPQFSDLSDQQITAIATWIHYARQQGRQQELTAAPVAAGDAAAGKTYFDATCAPCHMGATSLTGLGTKYQTADTLRAAVLDPPALKGVRPPARDTSATANAARRHRALLENYSTTDVQNIVAYLRSR